jgi:aconitate decarboxylase
MSAPATPSSDQVAAQDFKAVSNPSGITGKLCTWINQTTIDSIPEDVLIRAKYLILDGLACGLVGAHLPWSETAANAVFKFEPRGQCTVIGWEGKERKLSPIAAATLNSTFIQGFELDDYHSNAPLHSCSILIPALLAAVEANPDQTFSGREFLKAFIVGCEIGPRVGLALHGTDLLSRGWHSGAIQGPSAAAAAVSSLLALPPGHIESALGIACTQAGGLMSAQFGSMAKRMQHGFASRNGLYATLLAREGYTGIQEVYETPYGGFLSMFSEGVTAFNQKSVPEELISGLGDRWELHNIRIKLHAAMAVLHGTIDCIENLQHQHPEMFVPENLSTIEEITTQHSKPAYEHGGWIAPRDKPLGSTAAQMSIQYAAAAQLVDHQVLMAQYGADRLNRPLLRELMDKVHPTHNEKFDDAKTWRTVVNVRFANGNEIETFVDGPKGLAPPATNDEVVQKWRMLVKDVLQEERRADIESFVLALDQMKDVRELSRLLEGSVKCPIVV